MADTSSVADETVKNENEGQENEDDNEVVNDEEGTEAPQKKKNKKKKKKTGKLMAQWFEVYLFTIFVVTDFWLTQIWIILIHPIMSLHPIAIKYYLGTNPPKRDCISGTTSPGDLQCLF